MATNFAELQNKMAEAAEDLNTLKGNLEREDALVTEATESRDSRFGDYKTAIFTILDNKVLAPEYLASLGHVPPRRPAKAEPTAEAITPTGDELVTYVAEAFDVLGQLKTDVDRADSDVEAATARRDEVFGAYQDRIVRVLDEEKIYTPEMLASIGHVRARRNRRK